MPDVRVLNELQIKKDGVVATYRLGTVNGYYNSTDGKFYEEVTHVTEIEGAPNLVYADIAGNALYIYKTATSSFVKVSGEGGSSSDNLKFGYLNDEDGKFYEDDQYQVEIPGNVDYLFIGLDNNTIYRYDTSDTAFVVIGGGGGGTEYQAGIGIDITNGVISGDYTAGHGISIDNGVISDKTFVGTTAQWEALTSAQQAFYEERVLTDDEPDVQQKTNGHTIKDEDGVSKTQRSNLQFEGLDVTDDDVNDKTIVAPTTLKNEIYSVMGQNGAKNLLPYPYYQTTQKVANVDITDNGDGTITVNGTSNSNSVIFRYLNNDSKVHIPLKNEKYKVSFDVENIWGASFHFGDMRLIKQDDTTYSFGQVTGDFIIDNTSGEFKGIEAFSIYIAANTTVDNVTIKPMLRLASDTDDTYQPYAMTNKELTERTLIHETYFVKNGTSTSVESDTATDIESTKITVPAGTYLVLATAEFRATNGTGTRKLMVKTGNTVSSVQEIGANPSGYTLITGMTLQTVTTDTDINIRVNQTSDSAINVGSFLRAIRIK